MASPKTLEVLAEIQRAATSGQRMIAPAIFSHCYGMAATSAAFRMAKKRGIIEVAYISVVGTPCYQAAGINAAVAEAAGATLN